jgi:catechol 2,3-dioxygenase-like lactoylglutathione lyase family enzyme
MKACRNRIRFMATGGTHYERTGDLSARDRAPMIERLDHVAIMVADTERALEFFRDRLGLKVVAVDEPPPPAPPVRLTYLATGSVPIQLVEPLEADSPAGVWLAENGEGLHHICFSANDVAGEICRLAGGAAYEPGSGLGKLAAFLPGALPHGTRIEFTEGVAPDNGDVSAGERRSSELGQ